LGPLSIPQSPIPNPQSPIFLLFLFYKIYFSKINIILYNKEIIHKNG